MRVTEDRRVKSAAKLVTRALNMTTALTRIKLKLDWPGEIALPPRPVSFLQHQMQIHPNLCVLGRSSPQERYMKRRSKQITAIDKQSRFKWSDD